MFRLIVTTIATLASAWGGVFGTPAYQVREGDLSVDASIPYHYLPIGVGGIGIGAGGAGGGFGGGIGAGRFIGAGIGGAGGYYPGLVGAGAGIGIGGAGIGLGGGAGIGGAGIGGAGIGGGGGYIGGIGGEYIDKSAYSGGKKNLNDIAYEHANGKKGEEFEAGQGHAHHGKAAIKNVKGDSGFYAGEAGGKKLAEDEKAYHGGKHYNQEGM